MEELTDNAEEPDEAESKQSEVKLGKLQYKVKFFFSISISAPILDNLINRSYKISNQLSFNKSRNKLF